MKRFGLKQQIILYCISSICILILRFFKYLCKKTRQRYLEEPYFVCSVMLIMYIIMNVRIMNVRKKLCGNVLQMFPARVHQKCFNGFPLVTLVFSLQTPRNQ